MATTTTNDEMRGIVRKELAKRSFLTLATASAGNRPHVAGVLYAEVDGALYTSTHETSVKARNIGENPRVAVTIPVRRYPIGPPATIQFQGTAELLSPDHPRISTLIAAGRLKPITSHGELDLPGNCFVRIAPSGRIVTYGLGVSLRQLMREPLNAMRTVELEPAR